MAVVAAGVVVAVLVVGGGGVDAVVGVLAVVGVAVVLLRLLPPELQHGNTRKNAIKYKYANTRLSV